MALHSELTYMLDAMPTPVMLFLTKYARSSALHQANRNGATHCHKRASHCYALLNKAYHTHSEIIFIWVGKMPNQANVSRQAFAYQSVQLYQTTALCRQKFYIPRDTIYKVTR